MGWFFIYSVVTSRRLVFYTRTHSGLHKEREALDNELDAGRRSVVDARLRTSYNGSDRSKLQSHQRQWPVQCRLQQQILEQCTSINGKSPELGRQVTDRLCTAIAGALTNSTTSVGVIKITMTHTKV